MSLGDISDGHPIGEKAFDSALDRVEGVYDARDPQEYHHYLKATQRVMALHMLKDFLRHSEPPQSPWFHRVAEVGPDHMCAFVDYRQESHWTEVFQRAGIEEPDIQTFVMHAHEIEVVYAHPELEGIDEFREYHRELIESDNFENEIIDDFRAFVVEKPYIWLEAEESVYNRLRFLVSQGASPAEALDYWAVEEHDVPQTGWGGYRMVSQPTISENVAGGREVVESATFKPEQDDDIPSKAEVMRAQGKEPKSIGEAIQDNPDEWADMEIEGRDGVPPELKQAREKQADRGGDAPSIEMSDDEYEYTFDPMHDLVERWGLTMDEAEVFLERVGYFDTKRYHDIVEKVGPTDPEKYD